MDRLRTFLHQQVRPGYYVEHGPAFEAASIAMHADLLATRGWSLIDKHAARNRTGLYFSADLVPLTYEQIAGQVSA